MTVAYQPIKDRIIVKPITQSTKTAGGIMLPESALERPFSGTVLAAGPEAKQVQTGDTVIYNRYSGAQFNLDGEDVFIMKEDEALAVKRSSKTS